MNASYNTVYTAWLEINTGISFDEIAFIYIYNGYLMDIYVTVGAKIVKPSCHTVLYIT